MSQTAKQGTPKSPKIENFQVLCENCGEAVDTNSRYGVQRKITGWEELRKGGGANKIIGREATGEWRHSACQYYVEGQERLFEI